MGNLGTDVQRVGRLAFGLWGDTLKPGLVDNASASSVVSGDTTGGPLVADSCPQTMSLLG